MRSPRLSWFNVVSTFILLVVVVVTLYPFLHMLAVSLSSDVHVMKNTVSFWPKGFNLNMYKLVLGDSQIWVAYKNTLIYTVLGTLISLVVTSTGAYALSRSDMALRKSFTLLIVVTMFFSGGMIPTFLVVRSLDLVDTVWGMVLPGAVSTWNLILMRTFFSGIPKELEESGRIDGLNDIGIFIRIIVPLSKASFATIALFTRLACGITLFTRCSTCAHRICSRCKFCCAIWCWLAVLAREMLLALEVTTW